MGQAPSIPTDMSRELQVIGAGFSRTGTVSLAMALERLLHGPVMHSGTATLMREEAFIKKWISILQPSASPSEIKSTLYNLHAGYVATTDNPAIQFTRELTELYPSAIVICSTRDVDSWWASTEKLSGKTGLWWLDLVFWPVPTLRWFGRWRDGMGMRLEGNYGTSKANLDGPHLLTTHESYVRASVPADRLHFFNVKDGWEPLCKILDCPVPAEPFPRANDATSMQDFFEEIVKGALVRWLWLFLGLVLAVLTLLWVCGGRGGVAPEKSRLALGMMGSYSY